MEVGAAPRCWNRDPPQRAHRHADLEALEVFRRQDRLAAAGDLPEANVPKLVEGVQVDLRDHAAQIGAQLPVECPPYLGIVLEREANPVQGGLLRHRGQDVSAGQHEHLQRTAAQLRQHVRVAAELVVGEHAHFQLAARLLQDLRQDLLHPHVDRVRHGEIARKLEAVLRSSTRTTMADDCEQRQRRAGGEDSAACSVSHSHFRRKPMEIHGTAATRISPIARATI
jgi:hypothetical protein